jgi:uncharacterized protein YegP (UPF0339 family)
MKNEYDFSNAMPNPYAERLKGKPLSTPTTRGEQPSTGTVQIVRDEEGRYRWILKAVDGKCLAQSFEAYASLDQCQHSVDALVEAMAFPATEISDAA